MRSLGCKLSDQQQTALDSRSASVFWPEGREQALTQQLGVVLSSYMLSVPQYRKLQDVFCCT